MSEFSFSFTGRILKEVGIRLVILLCLAPLMFLLSCGKSPERVELKGVAQGSYYVITYYDTSHLDLSRQIDSIFKRIDGSVSLWNDTSLIMRVNRNESVTLNDVFIDNFKASMEAAELSGGYFDPTVSPLVAMWGFSYKNNVVPTQHNIDSIKEFVDYRKVEILDGKVIKQDERIALDFNAVAQGYTSDVIAKFLVSQGIDNFIVDVGGEIMASGSKPGNEPWVVGIEKPTENSDSDRVVHVKVRLRDKGLVTSGNYRKYKERDGKRYSHSIDPKTGMSAEHNLLSATVLAENATRADALASVCMVMGMEKSLPLIESLDGVEAYYIYVDDENSLRTYYTQGFEDIMLP